MKTTLTLLFILSLATLYSCYDPIENNPCPDTGHITNNIPEKYEKRIPYTGFDTLYFLNKNGDTCIVSSSGKTFFYETEYSTGGNPSCPSQYIYHNQGYSSQFLSLKGNLNFTLSVKGRLSSLYINRELYRAEFQQGLNILGNSYPGQPYYIDSILINGVKYGQITVFYPQVKNSWEGDEDSTYKLLYNKEYGILYIKSQKENEEFSRIPNP